MKVNNRLAHKSKCWNEASTAPVLFFKKLQLKTREAGLGIAMYSSYTQEVQKSVVCLDAQNAKTVPISSLVSVRTNQLILIIITCVDAARKALHVTSSVVRENSVIRRQFLCKYSGVGYHMNGLDQQYHLTLFLLLFFNCQKKYVGTQKY